MPRLKLTTLCLLAAAAAVPLATVTPEASARGLCKQISKQGKKVPKRGCVHATDVRKNSLTHEDMRNEAGFNFAEGLFFDRNPPKANTVYAKVDVDAPAFGQIVLTAHVELSTLTPQRLGGVLECNIAIERSPGFVGRSPGQKVSGSVKRGVKFVDNLVWTRTVQVDKGFSRFNLECQRTDNDNTAFAVKSLLTAEYYPQRY